MNNDQKILELRKKIAEERKALSAVSKFQPLTTCIIEQFGIKINLRTLTNAQLRLLFVAVNALIKSAAKVEMTNVKLSEFTLENWLSDVKGMLEQREMVERKIMINKLEDKLQSMLSDEKKTELEIESIEKLLAGD